MIVRAGNVVYWAASVIALTWAGLALWAEASQYQDIRWEKWAFGGLGVSALIWISGRAIKYVLVGK